MEVTKRGAYATVVLLDEVTLTNAFGDNVSDACDLSPFNQAELFAEYTMDGGETENAALIKIEFQEERETEWKELCILSDASPDAGVVLSTIYPRRLRILGTAGEPERRWFAFPSGAKALRVSAMEEGLVGNGGILTVGLKLSGVQKVE